MPAQHQCGKAQKLPETCGHLVQRLEGYWLLFGGDSEGNQDSFYRADVRDDIRGGEDNHWVNRYISHLNLLDAVLRFRHGNYKEKGDVVLLGFVQTQI